MERSGSERSGTMTQIRREVSLDSQGGGSGGSLGNSRLTLASRDTVLSVKSVSLDLVDAGIQVDLSADTITYDSDDEMVKRRVTLNRSKKGHPIYSREDIREQYCINKKELEVLENARTSRLFGCLANQQGNSPCNKNSILFSCVQKRKSSIDECADAQEYVPSKPPPPNAPLVSKDIKAEQYSMVCDESAKAQDGSQESADDDFASSGFRKRPKSYCSTDPRTRFSWVDSDSQETLELSRVAEKVKLHTSASLGSASQHSVESDQGISGRLIQRPSHLNLTNSGGASQGFAPSHSADELSDATHHRCAESQDWFCTGSGRRAAKTPDMTIEERRQKHVSFDSTSLVRSNTVAGGLEEVDVGPAATSTPVNTCKRSSPEKKKCEERLLDKPGKQAPEIQDRSVSSVRSMPDAITYQQPPPPQPAQPIRSVYTARPRRAMMKTQATQTELTFNARHLLPAYLTLSPRATHIRPTSRQAIRQRSVPRLTKSQSAHGVLAGEESEEDIMEIDLESKQHRLFKAHRSRSRHKRDSSPEKEIMVSFKPASPKTEEEMKLRALRFTTEAKIKSAGPAPGLDQRTALPDYATKKDAAARKDVKVDDMKESQDVAMKKTELTKYPDKSLIFEIEVGSEKAEFTGERKKFPVRRHSSIPTLPSYQSETKPSAEVKTPVKEDTSDTSVSIVRAVRFPDTGYHESSSVKSNTDSTSKGLISPLSDGQSTTHGSEFDNFSSPSNESPTMIVDRLHEVSEEQEYLQHTESFDVSKLTPEAPSSLNGGSLASPESESSSSHFTERETSRSEMSTSSSSHLLKSDNSAADVEASGSSDYITATEHSHRERLNSKRDKYFHTVCSDTNNEDGHTSFESASSASIFSSPSSWSGRAKSSTPSSADDLGDKSKQSQATSAAATTTSTSTASSTSYEDAAPPPPPACTTPSTIDETPRELNESSDESTRKDSISRGDSEEDEYCPSGEDLRQTPEDFDSDAVGNITPVHEVSSEVSTIQEFNTVIENIKQESQDDHTDESNFALNSDTDDRGLESSQDESDTDRSKSSTYNRTPRLSGELSTVSEVSEEFSPTDHSAVFTKDQEAAKATSDNGTKSNGSRRKSASSFEFTPSETTTPSYDSTTSDSFVLDSEIFPKDVLCTTTEEDSFKSSLSDMAQDLSKLQDDSQPSVSEKTMESQVSSDSSTIPEPPKAEPSTSKATSTETKFVESLPTPPADEPIYVTLTKDIPPTGQEPISSAISAPQGVGAIPKQRDFTQTRPVYSQDNEFRRKKERVRIKIPTTESVPFLPTQVSAAEEWRREYTHRSLRSLSRSPERHEDTPDRKLLCSNCGEKIGSEESVQGPSVFPPLDRRAGRPVADFATGAPRRPREPFGPIVSRVQPFSHRWGDITRPLDDDGFEDEEEDAGVHSESYRSSLWIYIGDEEESAVWGRPTKPDDQSEQAAIDSGSKDGKPTLQRCESSESTTSEKDFRKQYEAVTHRMIHRKASVEMYRRFATKTFHVDKKVTIQRNNGEFGFRIHGSRPVVVSAIEKETPAESCGLEVGDIIVSINGTNVLESSHSDVVRMAHTGSETLTLELSQTYNVLAPQPSKSSQEPLISGFLQRLSTCGGTARRWCRRWCILKSDLCLYWYKSEKDHEPLGAIMLQNHAISPVVEGGIPNAFRLIKLGAPPQYFAGDDEETTSRWISALSQVANKGDVVDRLMETSKIYLQSPSHIITSPDCYGYLGKFGARRKVWKRRYFVLKDACLYFYSDHTSPNALGVFYLHGYKVQSCTVVGKKNAFEAIPSEPKLKHLYLLADSDLDKKRWLAAMEYSIDRWIKVG